MQNELKVASCFSGIGGFEYGIEAAIPSARTVAQIEINDYCRDVLAWHWPEAVQHRDINDVQGSDLGDIDILLGGSPCQGFSSPGVAAGLEDERSALWFQMLRLVRETRPKYVGIENVSALSERGLDQVLSGLAEAGYDAEWTSLSGHDTGAPHRRSRIWILAYPNSLRLPLQSPSRVHGQRQRGDDPSRRSDGPRRFSANPWQNGSPVESTIRALADGLSNGVVRWREQVQALGNAIIPQAAFWLGQRIGEIEYG